MAPNVAIAANRISHIQEFFNGYLLLLDRGRVVEDGPHDDLVARDGHYAALHRQWRTGTQPTPDPEAD